MPISARSAGDGSSSTMIATFSIAVRKRRGTDVSASATCCSNLLRSTRITRDDQAIVVAAVANGALVAQRFRTADTAPVQDQRVGRARPPLFRQRLAQLLLDEDRIVALGDADPVRDAEDVPIHRQPGDAERVAEHDVRRLAAHARQLDELVHVGRHLAAMLGDESLRHAEQRLRLRAKKPGGVDQRFELRRRRLRERLRVRIFLEQHRRDQVDARVGRLRRQDRRDEQLERVPVMQLGVGVGMLRLERIEDLARLASGLQWIGPLFQPTFVYESLKTRQCSCRAAIRFGTNCTGTTTFVRTGARTMCSDSAALISFSESGITSQNVSVKSKGVCAMEQKFAYVRGPALESSGTIVKLICLGCCGWSLMATV